VILLYPLALVAAGVAVWRGRAATRGPTWRGFVIWTVAGGLMTFSLLTGLSIGLFIFPLAAIVLFAAARVAPRPRDSLGLFVGAALVIATVFVLL
jgi:hypothetical protein